ncbi:Tol biopolymer transport system component [Lewinella aquimaris]|uniref:Tol biopolymer transport system component n=1 Tax=Neolewinella aquimaris TaxID=1835722 RepID=A0A840E8X2_9BACT|nr:hypothetical protein [Neolewinella aquimaris]MBB4077506.1 Tol biopolymer transport system component [Neolewinella aquimaris]
MFRFLICLIVSVAYFGTAAAQAPKSQLYVFDIKVGDTLVTLTNPRYLSGFNGNGYNDHPHWADRNVLYASVSTPDMEQPDIYRFDLANTTRTRLTQTKSGEYSPKRMGDGSRFSAVRQEYVDRDTVLRLWEFPADLSDNGRPVFSTTSGIGYYEWLNNNQLALFLVGNPNQLVMASANGDSPRTLATNTGRTFTRLTNGNLVYVDKSNTPWQLVERNLYRLEEAPKVIAPMVDGTEDFVVLPDGSYLAGNDSKLYRLDPTTPAAWREVVDLGFYGLRRISRLAYDGRGQLAIVAQN